MPEDGFEKEKLEPLGGGYFALTKKAHTFGADAILLADFADPRGAKRLCDLCAGCGIVSLLWSAEDSGRQIDAVEIQPDAAALIKKAAEYNHFCGITALEADLRAIDPAFYGSYDLVACNPPYFKSCAGQKSRDDAAIFARHEILCTLRDAVFAGSHLLKNGGRLCFCHRPERLADLIMLMREFKVEPKRLRFVQQRLASKPWLVLIEGKKGAKPGLLCEPTLIVENEGGGYSNEMNGIYNKYKK